MSHAVGPDRPYEKLQGRLDRNITGAPGSDTFTQILKLLFSRDEADLARRLPDQPVALGALSLKLGITEDALGDKLTDMARRGLVLDMEIRGNRYFSLAPVVIGFFEFTMMRTRDEIAQAELARLFDQYMHEDDRFPRSLFQGETQRFRTLVRESALPQSDYTEILDWERASKLVESASALAVGLCSCRHKKSHLGTACDRPLRSCMTLNYGAEMLIRSGINERITVDEGLRLLDECTRSGMAITADNVQRKVSYICNCCSCCCVPFSAIKTLGMRNAVVTSNWVMEIDLPNCPGCGRCVKVCPVNAIEILQEGEGKEKRKWAVVDDSLCLGCGACHSMCKLGAIKLKPRTHRVFTPESFFDQMVMMAIERGKLAHLLFETPEKLSHRALGRMVTILEKSPPFRAMVAIEPFKSRLLETAVKTAKRRLGNVGEMIG